MRSYAKMILRAAIFSLLLSGCSNGEAERPPHFTQQEINLFARDCRMFNGRTVLINNHTLECRENGEPIGRKVKEK